MRTEDNRDRMTDPFVSNNSKIDELKGYILSLEQALYDARLFAEWVECIGRTNCEIYKHELKARADLSLDRIEKTIATYETMEKFK